MHTHPAALAWSAAVLMVLFVPGFAGNPSAPHLEEETTAGCDDAAQSSRSARPRSTAGVGISQQMAPSTRVARTLAYAWADRPSGGCGHQGHLPRAFAWLLLHQISFPTVTMREIWLLPATLPLGQIRIHGWNDVRLEKDFSIFIT